MSTTIPSAQEVRALLQPLNTQGLRALSRSAGVPFTTLWKVQKGETSDPRLETVRRLWPLLQPKAGKSCSEFGNDDHPQEEPPAVGDASSERACQGVV